MTLWAFIASLAAAALLAAAAFGLRALLRRMVEKQIAAFQGEMADRYLAEVQTVYRQMRGWRHDYHNHIQSMKACLAMEAYQRLETYLDQLDSDLTAVDTVLKSGNLAVDAVLNSKLTLARARNIAITAKARVPAQLPFGQVELGIILGNLLDNALEACEQVQPAEKRFLRLYLDVIRGGQLYFSLSNACGEVRRRDGQFVTRKAGDWHGLGLARVDAVVRRAGGWVNRQYEPGVFATEVFLPLPQEEDACRLRQQKKQTKKGA